MSLDLHRSWKRFAKDTRGNVLLLMGLGITTLIAAGGAGLDIGIQQVTKAKLQQALDASAMAAATIQANPDPAIDKVNRENAALNFYNVNFPATYLGFTRPTPTVNANIGAQTITMTLDTTVPTRLLRVIGINTIPTTASTVVGIATTPPPSQDVLLVLDVSGVMNLEDASLGPFMDPDAGATCGFSGPAGSNIFSCTGGTALNALRASTVGLATKLLNPNTNNNRVGGVTWSTTKKLGASFTSDYATIRTFLGQIYAEPVGRNSAAGITEAKAVGDATFRPGVVHTVILVMSDANEDPSTMDPATQSLCSQMKSAGTVVYTIGFGKYGAGNPSVSGLLQSCASGNIANNKGQYFYEATNATELSQVFNDIFTSIRKIRLTQ